MSINLSYYSIFSSGLDQGGVTRRVFRVLRRGFHFSPVAGKAVAIRRSELYLKVCSNRGGWLAEARAGGKSVRAGTHSLADLPI